jgi:hypothetical protein
MAVLNTSNSLEIACRTVQNEPVRTQFGVVAVDQVSSAGYGLVGGIGEYEGTWRMAYVRGPEGIIVALAQPID